jgi:hypothetical protein
MNAVYIFTPGLRKIHFSNIIQSSPLSTKLVYSAQVPFEHYQKVYQSRIAGIQKYPKVDQSTIAGIQKYPKADQSIISGIQNYPKVINPE